MIINSACIAVLPWVTRAAIYILGHECCCTKCLCPEPMKGYEQQALGCPAWQLPPHLYPQGVALLPSIFCNIKERRRFVWLEHTCTHVGQWVHQPKPMKLGCLGFVASESLWCPKGFGRGTTCCEPPLCNTWVIADPSAHCRRYWWLI